MTEKQIKELSIQNSKMLDKCRLRDEMQSALSGYYQVSGSLDYELRKRSLHKIFDLMFHDFGNEAKDMLINMIKSKIEIVQSEINSTSIESILSEIEKVQ